ncbi:MAG: LacI family DNA-binding transcriptional regulator [Chloroflexota bacterium]
MKPATIRDVAKRAGVGLGTVSRVLNDSPLVSQTTRQRVLAVIAELNFVPNPTARRLSLGKTLTVAVIVPFFTRPAFIERLRGIEHALMESQYDLNIYNVETVKRRDQCIHDVPRRERVDGVLIISLPPRDEDVDWLMRADVPIVLVDANHPSLTSFNRVVIDDVHGGLLATQHLIDLGHRRIGYISDWLESPFNFTSSRDRFRGYLQALGAAGISARADYHGQGEHGRYEARSLAENMLALPERPTAIFAASDTQAMGVLEAAREAGLKVPEEISVIGYDDIEVAEYLGLTTIRQLMYESGQRGVELLLDVLEEPNEEPVCEVLPTELIVRNTTAPPL